MAYPQRHGGGIDPITGLSTAGLPLPAAPVQPRHGGGIDPVTGLQSSPTPPMGHQHLQYQPSLPPQMSQQPYTHATGQPVYYGNGQYNGNTQATTQAREGVMALRKLPDMEQFQFRDNVQSGGGYGLASENLQKTEKVLPVNLKAWNHIVTTPTSFRWKFVNFFRMPGWVYVDQRVRRHRDFAGRISNKPLSDRYLHSGDGSLRNLIVQCTDDIFEGPANSTWRRTYVRNVSPFKSRVATWVLDFSHDPESWEDWAILLLRTFPAAIVMSLCFWEFTQQRIENGSRYAIVPYRFYGDAKVWGNHLENSMGRPSAARANHHVYRMLKPRSLCFLNSPDQDELHGIRLREVSSWEHDEGKSANLDYLFVAYSSKQFDINSPEDMVALSRIAEHACRAAKLPAFWVGSFCLDFNQLEAEVYRIADILRGAQRMVIAVGPPAMAAPVAEKASTDTDVLLRQWGSRMWTFPEVLLSPGDSITVYTRDNLNPPLRISKNQFAGRVWGRADAIEADGSRKLLQPEYYDAKVSGQLLDHYAGNLEMSRLELAVTLLKCLYARETGGYLPGDQAYALQGLLRLRPQIDSTDSQFQAFARLSLANDSDALLERYICTLPVSPTQNWHDMTDAYGAQLWDITPSCQVAAICDDDTVVVDGAKGSTIRWKSFYHVAYTRNLSWRRWFASILMEYQFAFFITALSLLATATSGRGRSTFTNAGNIIGGLVLLGLYLWLWLSTPRLVRLTLGGKLTNVQAALFGFEGYLNAPTVERAIFGGAFDRISWSSNGSQLSRCHVNAHGERVGVDPTTDLAVRAKVEAAKRASPTSPGMRVFTLVDTYNMEMTLFEAPRPPSCVFLCGAEGGMQRAVACSYDPTSQTMYRETVLRVPTTSLNRMDRVPRFRFGLRRPDGPFQVRPAESATQGV